MTSRDQIIAAFHSLNSLVGDFVIPVQIRATYQALAESSRLPHATAGAINRMCQSHLILALSKWIEFYDHFNKLIPKDCTDQCRNLNRAIKKRKISQFRNTVVGHIWNKKLNRLMSQEEIEAAFQAVVNNDADEFASWCNDAISNDYPRTIVSIVEHVRDRIKEEHGLSSDDLFQSKDAT